MKAATLYAKLEKDFIKLGLSDDWAQHLEKIEEFVSENFKKRSMGVVCDNSDNINRVYTAVFPTDEVLQKIIDKNERDAMLFVHHPSIWDISKSPQVWQQMNPKLLKIFRERKISIYNLHVPLDNFGEYSTGTTLANVLGFRVDSSFAPYFGGLAGVFARAKLKSVKELKKLFEEVVGHSVSLYDYGDSKIKNGRVAIVAGGGNDAGILEEVANNGVNTFVTGITVLNDYSKKAHEFAKKHKINILGGTHYSTEKFACQAMCKYFERLGLKSEFIEGVPGLEDI